MRQQINVSKKSLWARTAAIELMAKHGLSGWTFSFDKSKRRAGVCFHPHNGTPGRIALSVHYTENNTREEILDTILHEIAHALCGPGKGHGEAWKAKCRQVGARPIRCYDSQTVNMPVGRWQAQCAGCGSRFYRHRRPKHMTGWSCRKCGPTNGAFDWSETAG